VTRDSWCIPMDDQIAAITISGAALRKISEIATRQRRLTWAVRITCVIDAPIEDRYRLEFIKPPAMRIGCCWQVIDYRLFILEASDLTVFRGVHVDYVESMWRSGFRFDNPNVRPSQDGVVEDIERVLEERVRPAIAVHGGRVRVVEFRAGRAMLEFSGGCQGCGKAPATMKGIVAELLCASLPLVREVVDVTDHCAGTEPYYPVQSTR
jgi:Fe-S cluster biogenesis protein NfuA/Fe-S cluster assembly iron-binding protein IscA